MNDLPNYGAPIGVAVPPAIAVDAVDDIVTVVLASPLP